MFRMKPDCIWLERETIPATLVEDNFFAMALCCANTPELSASNGLVAPNSGTSC
jgi:hypothetical protein